MKKEYVKPQIDTKAYAQFENVFAKCTKGQGQAKNGCVYIAGWEPAGNNYAAFGDQTSSGT